MGLFESIFSKSGTVDPEVLPIPVGATLLIDGDEASADGWPLAKKWEQYRNLVHYVVALDAQRQAQSIVVFSEERTEARDELTQAQIQFAGPRWTVVEHIARLADARRGEEVLIATNRPHLFRNACTISIGDLLDHLIEHLIDQ